MQVKTTGCARHDHPEFTLDIGDALETDGKWLVKFLEQAVASGERFAPGETVAIGWMLTRVVEVDDDTLTLHEPDMKSMPIQWVPTVRSTLAHLRIQKAIAESVGLEDELELPSIRHTAIVCTELGEEPGMILARAEPKAGDSGWFAGCADPDHDHNVAENLDVTSLYQLAIAVPGAIGFLGLPAGVQVLIEAGAAPHIAMNGKRLPIKARSYLAQLITRHRD